MSGKRPGKRERLALREAQMARKSIVNANLSSPIERIFGKLTSSANRDTLLGGTHTMGFHSSSIRGHKAGGRAVHQRRARDGYSDK